MEEQGVGKWVFRWKKERERESKSRKKRKGKEKRRTDEVTLHNLSSRSRFCDGTNIIETDLVEYHERSWSQQVGLS